MISSLLLRKLYAILACCTIFIAAMPCANAQDGSLDPSFNPADKGLALGDGFGNSTNNSYASVMIRQPDGKLVVGGSFTVFNGVKVSNIVRLNADGTLDAGFAANNAGYGIIGSMALQSNGKIWIGGSGFIYLLNTDGTVDPSFTVFTGFDGFVQALAVQPDGKIIAGGRFNFYRNTYATHHIARLNTDGSIDAGFVSGSGFDGDVYSLSLQADGKILVGGQFTTYNGVSSGTLTRLNVGGTRDASFNTGGSGADNIVFTMVPQPDGKYLLGGQFVTYNGVARHYTARINADGTLDNSFDPGNNFISLIGAIAVQADGKILAGGNFYNYNGITRNYVARMNTDGTLDAGFSNTASTDNAVKSIAVQPDGKIVLAGLFNYSTNLVKNNIARLNGDGTVDLSFNPDSGAMNLVQAVAVQADKKIILGGSFKSYNGAPFNRLVRVDASGQAEPAFGAGGTNDQVLAIAVQADKKILVAGYFSSFNNIPRTGIARINEDGTPDNTFNSNGPGASQGVLALALQPNANILIAGNFSSYNNSTHNFIARIQPNGSPDNTFNPATNSPVNAVCLQPDGKLLIGGLFSTCNGSNAGGIARLNADGTLDAGFLSGTGTDGYVYAIALQADGKIVVAGTFSKYNGTARQNILRLNVNGSLDASFNPGTGSDFTITSLLLQPDGKIIPGGYFSTFNNASHNHLLRLNTDGTVDASFNAGTAANNDVVSAMSFQPDGKLVIGGNFTAYNGTGRNRVARVFAYPQAMGLNFDGVNDQLFLAAPAGFPAAGGSFSMEAWIRPSDPTIKNGIAGWGSGTAVNNFTTLTNADSAGLEGGLISDWGGNNLKVAPTGFNLFDGNWHHVACTYDGITRKIFVDGTVRGQDNPPAGPTAAPVNFRVGLTGSADYFRGDMDEIRIWNRAVCQDELQNNRNGELNPSGQTGLSVLYPLNQGIVGLNNAAFTSAIDISGNNNTATLNNFALTGTASNWTTGILTTTAPPYKSASLAGIPGGPSVCRRVTAQAAMATYTDTACNQLAGMASSGASPLTGDVNICVTVDAAVPFFNGRPYVQRHYDITPVSNAGTATATVTLYFTQAEFDAYNMVRDTNPSLPAYPSDTAGIAHLLVDQAHGVGTNPGNYDGGTVIINPVNSKIIWNAAQGRWEVTFDVRGFSGFFVYTSASNLALPLRLTSFSGSKQGLFNRLVWTTGQEQNTGSFELQRSKEGAAFTSIATMAAAGNSAVPKSYSYADNIAGQNQAAWYYRLKMIDLDGTFTYSNIVIIRDNSTGFVVSVSPNPFTDQLNLQVEAAVGESARLTLTDIRSKSLRQETVLLQKGVNNFAVGGLGQLQAGVYMLSVKTNTRQQTIQLLKQR